MHSIALVSKVTQTLDMIGRMSQSSVILPRPLQTTPPSPFHTNTEREGSKCRTGVLSDKRLDITEEEGEEEEEKEKEEEKEEEEEEEKEEEEEEEEEEGEGEGEGEGEE